MKKNLLLATTCFVATTFASTAWAGSAYTYHFNKLDSTETSTETFYCELSDADAKTTTVFLQDQAEMIQGFDKSGFLKLPNGPQNINNVYFKAYHDPAIKYKGVQGKVFVVSEKGSLVCKDGIGTNRVPMTGPFGDAP